ncbi:hypothetical protein [Herbidospora cretacea]|uniref:hypothetical protein n=1 Tax=Herbidospora cretacea TaxID=28444 RepID=UPI0004C358AD|nr:hypothetical protein [Herbidospora cretacea]
MNDGYDLSTPRSRREALRLVSLDDPVPDHTLLRQIFDYELAWRESSEEGVGDEFENIYLCAFLLFIVGDPADSPRMYRAKFGTSDFDLAIGFDAEAIFGAGRNETLEWLHANGFAEEEDRLTEWLAVDPRVEEWAEFRRGYFYSPDGELLLDPL